MNTEQYDREKVHLNLARIKKSGENFEIVVDSDKAIEYKEGKDPDIRDVLKAEKIFIDAKKGLLAPERKMKEFFGTSEPLEVAEYILKHGELQLTSEHRKKEREEKIAKIIQIIHKIAVDPKTNRPHPVSLIESAIKDAKININDNKNAEEQVHDVVKEIKRFIPIKFEIKEISIRIPHHYAARCFAIIKSMATVIESNWGTDGSFSGTIDIPGGIEEELFDKLNKIAHGEIESKLVKIK